MARPTVGPGVNLGPRVSAPGVIVNTGGTVGIGQQHPATVVEVSEVFYYKHTQSSPAGDWTIHHQLGKRPNISVYDQDGREVMIEIEHLDDNTAHIIWPTPTSGAAYCS